VNYRNLVKEFSTMVEISERASRHLFFKRNTDIKGKVISAIEFSLKEGTNPFKRLFFLLSLFLFVFIQ
jgi:hypothetical protein